MPTSLFLVEPAVDTVLEYLEAHYAAHVALVNAHYGNAPVITAPIESSFLDAEIRQVPELPCIMVLADNSAIEQEDPAALNAQHPLRIIIVDTASEQSDLRRKMYRHVAAMVNCLKTGEQAAAFKMYWRTPFANYSPVFTNNRQELFMDSQVLIRVQTEEAFA